jgi:hypothetical protein
MPLTQINGGMLDSIAQQVGFRNRIINGAMMIDQRNAGASVTPTDTGAFTYLNDRFAARVSQASKLSFQQSTTAPTGFINSELITSLSAFSIGASDHFSYLQCIEGLNVADLGWGTANAAAVTLSFWVRSSLTGTFGGYISNDSGAATYIYSYTIDAANTWEYKTITIAGDTSGTWLTNNGRGIFVIFSLGAGSSVTRSTGWGAFARSVTGQTNVTGTSGANFYITGVQLEKGSTATSFDYRPYGTELALCQRYYEVATVPASTSLFVSYSYGNEKFNYWQFKQTKRASPTLALGASASWVGATAQLFSGVDAVQIYDPSTNFFISGVSGVVGIRADSEL